MNFHFLGLGDLLLQRDVEGVAELGVEVLAVAARRQDFVNWRQAAELGSAAGRADAGSAKGDAMRSMIR